MRAGQAKSATDPETGEHSARPVTAVIAGSGQKAFGPVATLFRVESLEHAIRVANATSFGLSSSVWTKDDAERDTAIRELEAGAVFVNGMSVSYPELPFGGIKTSGYGRELGAPGIREFCNMKTVWEAPTDDAEDSELE